jgi:hypothetical protein
MFVDRIPKAKNARPSESAVHEAPSSFFAPNPTLFPLLLVARFEFPFRQESAHSMGGEHAEMDFEGFWFTAWPMTTRVRGRRRPITQ